MLYQYEIAKASLFEIFYFDGIYIKRFLDFVINWLPYIVDFNADYTWNILEKLFL